MPSIRRRPDRAELPTFHRLHVTLGLLRQYDRDQRFKAVLDQLRLQHAGAIAADVDTEPPRTIRWSSIRARADDPTFAEYVAAIDALTAAWGLDRLPDDQGAAAVHHWCRREGSATFGVGLMAKASAPTIDRTVRIDFTDAWSPEDEPQSSRRRDVPERLQPLYGGKTRVVESGARERILRALEAQLDAELARIADAYERAGYQFQDTTPARETHLRWTFERLALRRSVRTIADEDAKHECRAPLTDAAIRKTTEAIASELGLLGGFSISTF